MDAFISLILAFNIAVLIITNSAYENTFIVSNICDNTELGIPISYRGNVISILGCGTLCATETTCTSFSYDAENYTCLLNSVTAMDPIMCQQNIVYGAKDIVVQQQVNANLRLCTGSGNCTVSAAEGRVEIFYAEEWGTICDDGWEFEAHGPDNAAVVCSMLGYSIGFAYLSAAYGTGSGPIHLNNVACIGTEKSILDCEHAEVDGQNCSHLEDVGVVCS